MSLAIDIRLWLTRVLVGVCFLTLACSRETGAEYAEAAAIPNSHSGLFEWSTACSGSCSSALRPLNGAANAATAGR